MRVACVQRSRGEWSDVWFGCLGHHLFSVHHEIGRLISPTARRWKRGATRTLRYRSERAAEDHCPASCAVSNSQDINVFTRRGVVVTVLGRHIRSRLKGYRSCGVEPSSSLRRACTRSRKHLLGAGVLAMFFLLTCLQCQSRFLLFCFLCISVDIQHTDGQCERIDL